MPQNHGVVVVSPLPEDRVEFAPGDVLGFYVKGGRRNEAGLGVVALRDFGQRGDKGYVTEEVWYGTVADIIINPDPNCLFSVGPNGHLNTLANAAPVLSVSFGKYHCLYTNCLIYLFKYPVLLQMNRSLLTQMQTLCQRIPKGIPIFRALS